MTIEAYQQLIAQICEQQKLDPPESEAAGFNLRMADVDFTLAYQESTDSVIVFCDFGPMPDENRDLVLQRLLEINTFALDSSSPIFTINPETARVLSKAFIPIEIATADFVLSAMGGYTLMAQRWRRSYFLEDTGEGFELESSFQ